MDRKNKVLAVMHPPTAVHGRIMDMAGCEAGFVGTSGVVGTYTGLADVGTMTMTECVQVSRWIAKTVSYPIIMDGDTGHGGIMAVRRLIQECIDAGVSGIRIDDQPIEGKRGTQSGGIEVVPLEQAIVRYRAAVDAKNEIDPDFVIMAQCYARDAVGSNLDKAIARLKAYKEEAGVDWVQLESPHNVDEIKKARKAVKGAFSFMKGKMPRYLSLKEHLELGVNIAWYPSMTHQVTWAALWDFMQAFKKKEVHAWYEFMESRKNNPFPSGKVGPEGEGTERQREMEERYYGSKVKNKYKGVAKAQKGKPVMLGENKDR
jgi:2-methylisocitrate lyase-like PEP mutase family enzyme